MFCIKGTPTSTKFIKYTNSTLQCSSISPILFLHNLQSFTTTSGTVQPIIEGYSQADCLVRCWERHECFAVQMVYEAYLTSNVDWCALFAVAETSMRVRYSLITLIIENVRQKGTKEDIG